MEIPAALRREWQHERDWLDTLPRLVSECAKRWSLDLETVFETPHSLVVAAGDLVLKLNTPAHFEADHEADALALWAGRGAVRLLDRDDGRRALLLERCRPGTALDEDVREAPAIVAALIDELRTTPPVAYPFRLLAEEATRWTGDVTRRYEEAGDPFERRLLDRALEVFESVDRGAASLVNADLHAGNVLRAQRRPWLVIDPKPLVGEPELDGVGLLRNAAHRSGRRSVDRWLDALAAIGLDRARLVDWGVAHTLAWGWDARRGWLPAHVEAARVIAASSRGR